MESKNTIRLELKKLLNNQTIEIDGISFSNIAYIIVIVDEVNLLTIDFFKDSFVVFKELKKSEMESGKYLLFTSASGIADDAGWEYVEVLHNENLVTWNIQRDESLLSYVFDKTQYINEITKIEKKIENLNISLKLEPLYVVYPE